MNGAMTPLIRIWRRMFPKPDLAVHVWCTGDDRWHWTVYRRNPKTWEQKAVANDYIDDETAGEATILKALAGQLESLGRRSREGHSRMNPANDVHEEIQLAKQEAQDAHRDSADDRLGVQATVGRILAHLDNIESGLVSMDSEPARSGEPA